MGCCWVEVLDTKSMSRPRLLPRTLIICAGVEEMWGWGLCGVDGSGCGVDGVWEEEVMGGE